MSVRFRLLAPLLIKGVKMITRVNEVFIDTSGDVVVILETDKGFYKTLELSPDVAIELKLYLTEIL